MNKSGIDIIDRLYFLIEGSGVSGLISGKVYKNSYDPQPDSVESEFIVINTLPMNDFDVVRGINANINLYIVDKDGQTDLSRFRGLISEIEEKLKPYETLKGTLIQKSRDKAGTVTDVETDLTKEYFKFRLIMSHGPFKDERENNIFKRHSKFNFRLRCWIEK